MNDPLVPPNIEPKKPPKWLFYGFIIIILGSLMVSLFPNAHDASDGYPATGFSKGVGLMKVVGPIAYGKSEFGLPSDGVELWSKQLEDLCRNAQVKSIVIQINSPGGTAASSSEFFQKIEKLKNRFNKPIIISIADVGASGAYWIALAGDKIVANPVSIVGSIGVIMGQFDLTEVKDKYGIGQRTYKSAPYKDFLSSWREPTIKEEEKIQKLLMAIHSEFVQVLARKRDLSIKAAETLADGSIYSGRQAKEQQLIDELGSLEDAVEIAAKLGGLDMPVPIYRPKTMSFQTIFDLIGTLSPTPMNWLNSFDLSIPHLR